MIIIVTGGTGQIGSAVLRRCLQDAAITKVFALTRRPLDEHLTSSGKIKNIIHSDFSEYPDHLLAQLKGAEACIWSIGVIPSKGKDKDTLYQGNVATSLKGATAFVNHLQPALGNRKFRFVYVSGWAAERDQTKNIWLMPEPRRSKVNHTF
jgi:nucleoside-diphosphate-sugar epimerase